MTVTETYRSFPSFAEWSVDDLDLRFWRKALDRLESERARSSPEAVAKAHEFAIRTAAVDTAAIEGFYPVDRGFTFSVAAQTGAWQHYFDERGEKARATFEDQLRSFELVMDAATHALPVVEALIRSLHELVCASQSTFRVLTDQGWQDQELTKGEYKRLPNNPHLPDGRQHHYAPPIRVKEEMERLVAELATPAFLAAQAPLQAAYAHYAFVAIHPFADGNGRVARALTSIYLVRATSVPFVLFADQKPGYQDALGEADRGNWGAFSEYVRDRSMDGMRAAATSLVAARPEFSPEPHRLSGPPPISRQEFKLVVEDILRDLETRVVAALKRRELPQGLRFETLLITMVAPEPFLSVTLTNPPPAYARREVIVRVRLKLDADHPLPIRIEAVGLPLSFDVRLEEVAPTLSSQFTRQSQDWTTALAGYLISSVLDEIQGDRTK
jgi:Fic family protein